MILVPLSVLGNLFLLEKFAICVVAGTRDKLVVTFTPVTLQRVRLETWEVVLSPKRSERGRLTLLVVFRIVIPCACSASHTSVVLPICHFYDTPDELKETKSIEMRWERESMNVSCTNLDTDQQ